MDLPIISSCSGDIRVYGTVDEAIDDMEACDVVNGEYVVYDSAGKLLHLYVEKGKIHIEDGEAYPYHVEELRDLLLYSLQRAVTPAPSSNLTLSELIELRITYEATFDVSNQPSIWKRLFSFGRRDP